MEFSKSAIATILDKKGTPKKGSEDKAPKTEKVEKTETSKKAEKIVGEIDPKKTEKPSTEKK